MTTARTASRMRAGCAGLKSVRMVGMLMVWVGVALASVAGASPAATARVGLERYEYRQVVFGVEARLVLYATDDKTALTAAEAAWARFEELDAALSDWRVDSELSLLREAPVGEPLPIGTDLFAVLQLADELHSATAGAFDASVGPFVKLWREARTLNRLPAQEDLAAAAVAVGWDKLTLEASGDGAGFVVLTVPGMALDLGGLAKGYGAQQALLAMSAVGVNRALVEVGGDVAAGDAPPDRDGWDTLAGCGPGRAVRVSLTNESLAVSGDTEQFLEVDGRRYSHLIDPRTGLAVSQRTCASVVAKSGAVADALASAVQVIGPREGRSVVGRVAGARVVYAERLDLPVAQQFRDPLRVAPLLELEFGMPHGQAREAGERPAWTEEEEVLVGRLFGEASGPVRFPAGTNWSLEMQVWGNAGADLLVHPDADQLGKDAVRLGIGAGENLNAPSAAGRGNHWEVRCTGFDRRFQVWRDGDLVQDLRIPSSKTSAGHERKAAFTMVRAELSTDGAEAEAPVGMVRVRGLKLRRLESVDDEGLSVLGGGKLILTEDAELHGWRSLIDLGMSEWEEDRGSYVSAPLDYRVTDGVLHIPSSGGGGQLRTKQDFQDFRLRMEFKLAPGANSGLFLRGDRAGGDPAYSGCEVQIIDDHGWEGLAGFPLQERQKCGSLYGAVAAQAPGALRPTGEWNTYEVLMHGRRMAVALNGRVLYDVNTHELECEPPFADRVPTGFIGLQRYGAPHVPGDTALWVRNMFVREYGQKGDSAAPGDENTSDGDPGTAPGVQDEDIEQG